LGTTTVQKNHMQVVGVAASIQHSTGSDHFSRSGGNHGMDMIIYKISDDGVPAGVYAVDLLPHDGDKETEPRAYYTGLATFEGNTDEVATVAYMREGKLTFPADGADIVLEVASDMYEIIVSKVDMATKKTLWASKSAASKGKPAWVAESSSYYGAYSGSVTSTAAGHVIGSWMPYERTKSRSRVRGGALSKFSGTNGATVWEKTYTPEEFSMANTKMAAGAGETVYVPGAFKGKDSTAIAPLTMTSCNDGESTTSFITHLDVSPSDGPAAAWAVVVGCGGGATGTFVEGDYLYVVGELNAASTLVTLPTPTAGATVCTLNGDLGGFLVKLNKADGTCVWAKDTAFSSKVVADGNSVWTMHYPVDYGRSYPHSFDAAHTLKADNNDILMGRYQASDGAGMWGVGIGGSGDDRATDMAMTPAGPLAVGYSESEKITIGDAVTAVNLKHQAAEAEPDATDKADAGGDTMFVIQLSKNDVNPSCVTCAAGEDFSDATITTGSCYADSVCLSDGDRSPSMPCFRCDSGTDQKVLTGPITNTDEHCYWDGMCYPKGFKKDNYRSYNADSVCEICQPLIKADGFSLLAGHFHDRDFALTETQRGSYGFQQRRSDWTYNQISQYGMVFESQSNGCQVLPEMTPTVTVASSSMTTSEKLDQAIKAVNDATVANKGAETAWMYWGGDTATCTKAPVTYDQGGTITTHSDLCENTPAHAADEYAAKFETILYYGQAMARVKVQQGLVILKAELSNGNLPAAAITDLKHDIIAHMLVTGYQVVIHSAHAMNSGTAADKTKAQSDGLNNWNVIKAHWVGNQNDKERLGNLFAGTPDTSFHYCTASELLLRNMPASSSNHYGAADTDFEFSKKDALEHTVGVVNKDRHDANAVNSLGEAIPLNDERASDTNPDRTYLSPADVGVLRVARDPDGKQPTCTFPPSPPPPPSPPAAPLSPETKKVDSGLSEGEIAGVAVGATVGGVVLLVLVGLILRSLIFKEAKPVFTCLEKAPASDKSPA